MRSIKHLIGKFGKPVLAGLLVMSLLLLNALVAVPSLHQLCHQDSDHASHACVVTLFEKGQIETANCDVPIAAPAAGIETIPSDFASVPSFVIENLPPGRAPPAVIASPV